MPAKATKWSWRRQTLRPGFSPSQTPGSPFFRQLNAMRRKIIGTTPDSP